MSVTQSSGLRETPPWELFITHFSEPRISTYLEAAHGDRNLAKSLYRWNEEIGLAFWESFIALEVSLRNALSRALQARLTRLGADGAWTDDPLQELGRSPSFLGKQHLQPYAEIVRARQRISNSGHQLSRDRIVAELSFGFWQQIVSKKHTVLWPDLAREFPHIPKRDVRPLRSHLSTLREIRNRIGHHHQVLTHDIGGKYQTLLDALKLIDPDLATYVADESRVPPLLARDPRLK
jgi:hypothetical protein